MLGVKKRNVYGREKNNYNPKKRIKTLKCVMNIEERHSVHFTNCITEHHQLTFQKRCFLKIVFEENVKK